MALSYGDICRVVKSGAVMIEGKKYKADELKAFNGKKVVITLSIKNVIEKSVLRRTVNLFVKLLECRGK